jgi:hypothetical protein
MIVGWQKQLFVSEDGSLNKKLEDAVSFEDVLKRHFPIKSASLIGIRKIR